MERRHFLMSSAALASGAMQGLSSVGTNTSKFTSDLCKLTNNLTALNNVYGSMLTAMKGSGK